MYLNAFVTLINGCAFVHHTKMATTRNLQNREDKPLDGRYLSSLKVS